MKIVVHPAAQAHVDGIVRRPGGTVLLHGVAGVGKSTIARELARQLNCAGCDDDSCRSCRMAAAGNHPDIIWLQPDDKGKIGIEAVHELQHSLRYQQYEAGSRRVVIIDDADMLTLPAEQALLKTLEEPPAGTAIILTAASPSTLLPTVVSRCRLVYVPPVAAEQLEAFITDHYPGVDGGLVVRLSRGLPARAMSYIQDEARATEDEVIAQEVEALLKTSSIFERLQVAGRVVTATNDRPRYLAELIEQVRASSRRSQSSSQLEAVERLLQRLRANVNPKTAFEALAVEL